MMLKNMLFAAEVLIAAGTYLPFRGQPVFVDAFWLDVYPVAADTGTKRPATEISWTEAREYCRSLGKDLPTNDQWEYAAWDGGRNNEAVIEKILAWYGSPPGALEVGRGKKNGYGVHDLHGLIWEWTLDFEGTVLDQDNGMFCGAAALGATRPEDYATFMRYSLRKSLSKTYKGKNLGFRCARAREKTERSIDLAALNLQRAPTVLAMVYTHCRSACPIIMADLKAIERGLSPSEQRKVNFAIFSLDPERDTPETLKEFARKHGVDRPQWSFHRGSLAAARKLALALGIAVQSNGSGEFAHANAISILDARGAVVHQQVGLSQNPAATLQAIRNNLSKS